jgi:dipeptidyl aminopeptidase/acylaminoacyl peptidase
MSGHAAIDLPAILGGGPTADSVLVEIVTDGRRLWQLLSIEDGRFSPMPAAQVFTDPLMDEFTGLMIGGVNIVDAPQYVFFDPKLNLNWQAIVKAFSGDQVTFVSASRDYSEMVVLVDGPNYGYRYVLIDLKHPAAVPIGNVYAGIDKPLAVRAITYAAGDGLKIRAYLTLPDRPAHYLPLVVLPHGGPAVRDTADFDWWSQALADQGYAVLRPNYRGSNVDEPLLEAGFGQWGRKMQTDLSDGVSYLVKQDIVDPAKVCIVGGSYGGYAALAGVTLQPTVYRCAVSVAGISDLAQMMRWETRGGIEDSHVTRYWDRYWGVSASNDPALDQISPIKHVDAVRAPVLLIHGRDDTVVPYEQSQIMYDALNSEKKDVQLLTLKKEDHWLSGSDTRLQMLQATVAFLRAHNPPD